MPHDTATEAKDILAKRSALNMLLAFAIALKHHLREERGAYYEDLYPLIAHLPRKFHSHDGRPPKPGDISKKNLRETKDSPTTLIQKPNITNTGSRDLELPSSLFLHDRRDIASHATLLQGNLPLELATYLSSYIEDCVKRLGTRVATSIFTSAVTGISAMVDVLTQTERVLRTPLPLAYNIATSQAGAVLRSQH